MGFSKDIQDSLYGTWIEAILCRLKNRPTSAGKSATRTSSKMTVLSYRQLHCWPVLFGEKLHRARHLSKHEVYFRPVSHGVVDEVAPPLTMPARIS